MFLKVDVTFIMPFFVGVDAEMAGRGLCLLYDFPRLCPSTVGVRPDLTGGKVALFLDEEGLSSLSRVLHLLQLLLVLLGRLVRDPLVSLVGESTLINVSQCRSLVCLSCFKQSIRNPTWSMGLWTISPVIKLSKSMGIFLSYMYCLALSSICGIETAEFPTPEEK
jgi:hypothetical protein